MSTAAAPPPSLSLRIDTQHHVLELIQKAVSRIAGSVQVQLADEHIFLTGQVNSWHQKQFAQESIRPHAGQRIICNSLKVVQS